MSPPGVSAQQKTLLVVEDTADCIVTLELALAAIPHVAVRFVASAEQALAALAGASFAALITDVNLPGMDGLELLSVIRGNPRLSRLPVLVVSGDTDLETPGRALRLGANAFFGKPYSPAALRRRVEELLNEN